MALLIKDLSVKFYSSKSYSDALLLVNTEPGAICFVSDETGNYIVLDGKVFGDGTSGGGGGSGGHGDVTSVNGKTGVVVLLLSDFYVATVDGQNITLADYFNQDGAVISNSFIVTEEVNGNPLTRIAINKNGIYINGEDVATQTWVLEYVRTHSAVTEEIQQSINSAELSAKDYADSLVSSVYKIKGSVQTYNDLLNIQNPKSGWVYNVISSYGGYPPGTNYVCVIEENPSTHVETVTWDALGGSIDLSAYALKSEVTANIATSLLNAKLYTDEKNNALSERITTNSNTIGTLQSSITTINSTLDSHTSSISTHTTQISQNTTEINNIATQLTWQ